MDEQSRGGAAAQREGSTRGVVGLPCQYNHGGTIVAGQILAVNENTNTVSLDYTEITGTLTRTTLATNIPFGSGPGCWMALPNFPT
jgi:hypothetical protein